MKEKAADKWLKIQSVAETLGCTDAYVYSLIREGAIKAMKLGERALRVSEWSLQKFISARVVNPEDYFAPEDPSPEPEKPAIARSKWMSR